IAQRHHPRRNHGARSFQRLIRRHRRKSPRQRPRRSICHLKGGLPVTTALNPAAPAAEKPAKKPNKVLTWMMNNGALVGLFILCVALFIATPHFLTVNNFLNIGIQAATVAILAFGMTFVIITACIGLSVRSVAALGAMVSASLCTDLCLLGSLSLIIGLLTGLAAGAFCGFATAYGKIPSFIATLALMSIARGAT